MEARTGLIPLPHMANFYEDQKGDKRVVALSKMQRLQSLNLLNLTP